ncbi:DUF6894 family protein [Microvirga calopogonii]|uniref:DUF6894 family protein n=1 Tax=Microvirga calopogonii TaxID=2078013 RepID=UPI001FE0CFB8|nr:hypothetical protein [Microvirga calopogonii]
MNHRMPGANMRCFFHLVNGDEAILDDTGVEVSDLKTAKTEAEKAISELRREFSVFDDWVGWRLNIVSSNGTLLCSLPLDKTIH